MGHFVTDEVDRINIDKGHWVDIRRRMSYGDQQRLVASYMKLQTQMKSVSPDAEIDLETGNMTLLLINVKEWNLEKLPGEVAPITEETIKQLDPAVAGKLIGEINKRNQPPKA